MFRCIFWVQGDIDVFVLFRSFVFQLFFWFFSVSYRFDFSLLLFYKFYIIIRMLYFCFLVLVIFLQQMCEINFYWLLIVIICVIFFFYGCQEIRQVEKENILLCLRFIFFYGRELWGLIFSKKWNWVLICWFTGLKLNFFNISFLIGRFGGEGIRCILLCGNMFLVGMEILV